MCHRYSQRLPSFPWVLCSGLSGRYTGKEPEGTQLHGVRVLMGRVRGKVCVIVQDGESHGREHFSKAVGR